MGTNVLGSADFTGVMVETDFHNVLAWGIPLAFLIPISFVFFVIIGEYNTGKKFNIALCSLTSLVATAVPAFIIFLASANYNTYDENIDTIKDHYSIDLISFSELDEEEKGNGGIFTDDSKSLLPVVVESETSVTEAYMKEIEEGRWAVLVDANNENSGELVEFDEFAADEGDGENLEEMGD